MQLFRPERRFPAPPRLRSPHRAKRSAAAPSIAPAPSPAPHRASRHRDVTAAPGCHRGTCSAVPWGWGWPGCAERPHTCGTPRNTMGSGWGARAGTRVRPQAAPQAARRPGEGCLATRCLQGDAAPPARGVGRAPKAMLRPWGDARGRWGDAARRCHPGDGDRASSWVGAGRELLWKPQQTGPSAGAAADWGARGHILSPVRTLLWVDTSVPLPHLVALCRSCASARNPCVLRAHPLGSAPVPGGLDPPGLCVSLGSARLRLPLGRHREVVAAHGSAGDLQQLSCIIAIFPC